MMKMYFNNRNFVFFCQESININFVKRKVFKIKDKTTTMNLMS